MIDPTVGQFIRENRERLGMTQAQLGKKLGYRYGNFITMLEGGNAGFPVDKWKKYAEALEVPEHEFLKVVLGAAYPDMMPYLTIHAPKGTGLDRESSKRTTTAPEKGELRHRRLAVERK
jgi:transcriptional regulator with XRE-family HTH domain